MMALSFLANNWFFWALIPSFCMAIISQFNHSRRLDPQLLNAWHLTFAALILLAGIPFMIWPEWDMRRNFYIVAMLSGLVMGGGMVVFFWLSLRRTGRVTSMVIPLAAIGAYIVWWLLVPESHPQLMKEPSKVYVSIIAVLVICFAIQKLRSNDASWETFVYVLPLGLAFGARDALTKYVVSAEMQVYATAMTFTFISLIVAALVAWTASLPHPAGGRLMKRFDGKILWAGFWCGLWTVAMLVAGVIALRLAPNPAYPGIIMTMTPIWLYAYNYVRGVNDELSPMPGALIMIGAVILLLTTL